MNTLSPQLTKALLGSSKGRMMTVEFIKADGSKRLMYCKTGIKKALPQKNKIKGRTRGYTKSPKVFSVFDCQKKGYRYITLDRVLSFRCGNVHVEPHSNHLYEAGVNADRLQESITQLKSMKQLGIDVGGVVCVTSTGDFKLQKGVDKQVDDMFEAVAIGFNQIIGGK